MPTLKHPPDDIAWEIPNPCRYYPTAVSTHIYFALTSFALLIVARLLVARWRTRQGEATGYRLFDEKHESSPFSPGSSDQTDRHQLGANSAGPRRQASQPDWAPGFVPPRVVSRQLRPLGELTTMDMDGSKGGLREDCSSWSPSAASRGVSTSSQKAPHPSYTGPSSFTVTGRTRQSRSSRTSSQASSGRRHSGSSDGTGGQASGEKGKGLMAGSSSYMGDGSPPLDADGDAGPVGMDLRVPRHFSRPPPPPPLTPPTLSGSFFPFEDRRVSYAASIPPALDLSFIHQPNPEYGGCSTSTDVPSSSPQSASPIPRRRSYTKSIPIGIPAPTTTASASSSTETMTSGSTTNTFSPSSYPPTSPLLPPPPPGQYDPPPSAPPEYEFVGGPGGPGIFLSQQEIDLQGEIISVMDDAGHGWKRHTRVYGGGVCLACVAAAQRDGDGRQGGFYGDRVPLEDRR